MHRLLFVMSISIIFLLSEANITVGYEKEIKNLSLTMADNIVKAGKKTIAVVDFTDLQGNVTELGRFIAEEFSVALAGAGKGFEVVDRTHLKSILQEHKLALTGLIDPSTARKLGQIAGVHAIITGTITPFGDSVRLSVKILDTGTAKVIGASSGDIAKTKAIEELLAKGIEPAVPISPPPRIPSKHLIKVQNFTFELMKAEAYGENVTCYLLITNNDPRDRTLYINRAREYSFIIDNLGNKYVATEVRLGTKSVTRGGVGQLLVSGISTSASIISNISPKAHMIALLEIACGGEQSFKVQFRNIPLTR